MFTKRLASLNSGKNEIQKILDLKPSTSVGISDDGNHIFCDKQIVQQKWAKIPVWHAYSPVSNLESRNNNAGTKMVTYILSLTSLVRHT